ncbi:CvpA family protein [Gilvimarinus polysaccharolyticus]|uniref:CvpA family protein n=1 Tax=Gilvimarinus polysaccharolyticus TaxID=863921 RepID=UPI0006737893|nr:CvpA family protein [Gilvimarinus polysaccharolyticus]
MGVSAIIFGIATAFFAIRGYFNGFWGSLARIAALIGAYAAAFFYSKDAAELIKQYTPIDGIVAYIAGSLALFSIVLIAIRLLFWLLIKLTPSQGEADPDMLSRVGGAVLGGAAGAFIGLLLVYLFGVYTAAQNIKQDAPKPTQNLSSIDSAARTLISKSAGGLMTLSGKSDNAVRISESVLANPVASLDRVARVSNNPDVHTLIEDPRAQRLMQQGKIDELMQVPAFKRMMQDDDLRLLMQSAGMDIDNRDDARDTAKKFALGYQQYQIKKDDPRVRAILQDAEFQSQLRSENKLPLLMNPKVNELAEIIFVEGVSSIDQVQADNEYHIEDANNHDEVDETGKTIYRHTDENGRTYYSDRPQK